MQNRLMLLLWYRKQTYLEDKELILRKVSLHEHKPLLKKVFFSFQIYIIIEATFCYLSVISPNLGNCCIFYIKS